MLSSALDTVRLAYAAYAARDMAAIFALLDPEIEIVQTPLLPWGGVHHGLDGAQRFFHTLGELTAAVPVPTDFIVAGEDIVVTGRLRGHARLTGAVVDLAIAHVLTVRHGRIVRFAAYVDTPAMLAALGADADH